MEIREKVDMHIHTSASDGTWTPEKLIEKIIEKDIKVFSVTDHDSVENVKRASELANLNGNLIFIPGVEINTLIKDKNYHILGYGIDPLNDKLSTFINANRNLLADSDNENIKFLETKYPNVSFLDYMNYKNNSERGGWKSLNYLADKGLCTNFREFFELFDEGFGSTVFPPPYEAVEAIIQAGGIPVLAHPGAAFYDKDYKSILNEFLEQGIKGIECYHPENSIEITNYCLEFCKKNQLLITGGSDCHGDFIKTRKIGTPDIRLEQLNLGSLV